MNNLSQENLKGKRVLIRVDFNVPLDKDLNITDDSRMLAALPTIKKVISNGGVAIILSHLGRPKDCFDEKFSLQNIVPHLSFLLKKPVSFLSDCIDDKNYERIQNTNNGGVVVLENLRFYKEEKNGDKVFAKKLSRLGDIYINDAFGTAHRAHASTAIIAKFFPKNKHLGLLLNKEITFLEKILNNPKRPFTAVIGGAKITGKIDVIESLLKKVDNLIIGGGMAYTFAKAMGGEVGKSLVENEKVSLAKKIISSAEIKGVNLLLPTDSLNAPSINNITKTSTSDILSISKNDMGLDIGKQSIMHFSNVILESKTILWNGPMGVFELESFENGTKKIGEAICLATKNGAFSLIGGGDSTAAVKKFGFSKHISYISTGGGAMLEYLEGKILPSISAILD